ncbi:MAG: type II toxin-antitoxin system PemK/MazF family toxin [Thermoleophilia bacterium]
MTHPRRGEIYWVDFEPAQGSEPNKVRPALVVQNDTGNRFSSTTIVVAITSRQPTKEYPFLVCLPDDLLPQPSVAVCTLVRTVSLGRLSGGPVAVCDAAVMDRVDQALRHTFALT